MINKALDWHLKIDDDEEIIKRRKIEEVQNIVASVSLRIKQTKLRHKREKDFNNEGGIEENVQKSYLMRYPPMNGLAWFGVSSADSMKRAYLGIRPKFLINQFIWDKNRSHTSNFRHIFDEIQTNRRNENFALLTPKELNLSQFFHTTQENLPNTSTANEVLWVDKYSPSAFSDLLTEDVKIFIKNLILTF